MQRQRKSARANFHRQALRMRSLTDRTHGMLCAGRTRGDWSYAESWCGAAVPAFDPAPLEDRAGGAIIIVWPDYAPRCQPPSMAARLACSEGSSRAQVMSGESMTGYVESLDIEIVRSHAARHDA